MVPTIAVSIGDPAGVGPEVIVKAYSRLSFPLNYRLLVIGDENLLTKVIEKNRLGISARATDEFSNLRNAPETIPVYCLDKAPDITFKYGAPDKECGDFSFRCVLRGIQFGIEKKIDALVTAPISKEAWHMAGHVYDGHTELLATKTDTRDYRMMFASSRLNVILVTTHLSLRSACDALSVDKVFKTIKLGADYLIDAGIKQGKIAVCGLNPHASENGLFGQDEKLIIQPAIENAVKAGINVFGPFPSDTIFLRAARGEFDLVIAMYHDQGLIPVKLIAFEEAVNITLGLPFVRTSVDHGTAFDIAGKGEADPQNMLSAINQAFLLVKE